GGPAVVVGLALGTHVSCALLDDGTTTCWGVGHFHQTGFDDLSDRLAPLTERHALGAGAVAVAIDVGDDSACVWLASGEVRCWGANGHGQSGTATGLRWAPSDEAINLGGR